jgi:hypothetical protein
MNRYYTSEESGAKERKKKKKRKRKRHTRAVRLETFPVGVTRLSGPRIRRKTPLTPPLCVRSLSRPRAMLISGTRHGRPSSAPFAVLDGNGTCARGSLRYLLLALLEELVIVIGGGARTRAERVRAASLVSASGRPTIHHQGLPSPITNIVCAKSPLRALYDYVGWCWCWWRRRR